MQPPYNFLRYAPNLISLSRLCLVPVVIGLISTHAWVGALICFILAGLSDAVDGWIAKHFHLRTEFGAYLDPLADKALLISIFVALAVVGILPAALAFLVVFRDIMIICAIMVSWGMGRPLHIQPLWISKINTTAQILLVTFALSMEAFHLPLELGLKAGVIIVALTTILSALAYLRQWLDHMTKPA